MAIQTDGPLMEPENKGIDEFHVGYGASLRATAAQAWEDSPVMQMFGLQQMDKAKGQQIDFGEIATGMPTPGLAEENAAAQAAPRVDMIDAIDQVKKAGLASHLKLPDQPDIPQPQLAIMMDRAQRRQELDTTIERGPQGFVPSALSVGTSFAVGAVDPLNVASAFIPVVGELRYGKILASAGDSLAARLAVRAGVGAAEGAVGQAALEPLDWWSHTQDGRDFGMADVLQNLMFGAALGGGLHGAGGFISDAYRRRVDRPLFPYDLGEPLEQHPDWSELRTQPQPPPLPRDVLGEFPGVERPAAAQAPTEAPRLPESPEMDELVSRLDRDYGDAPSPAVDIINDLPQRAHEDAMRATIASLIDGEPVKAGEMIEAAARTDPRIAESLDLSRNSAQSVRPAPIAPDPLDLAMSGELTADRARQIAADLDQQQKAVEEQIFHGRADEWRKLMKRSDRAWDNARDDEARALDRQIGQLEDEVGLTQADQDWLDGKGWGDFTVGENWEELAHDLQDIENGRDDAIAAASSAVRYLPKTRDWSAMNSQERQAVLTILTAMNEERKAGRDPKDFLRDTFAERIKRYGGGADAHEVTEYQMQELAELLSGPLERSKGGAAPVAAELPRIAGPAPKGKRGRAAADPQTWSLFEFLAHEGGLKPDPELQAIFGNAKGPFVPGFGPLVRPKGRALDDALRLAKDHGYLFDAADVTGAEGSLVPRDLLDRLAEENSGRKQYRQDQQHATKAEATAATERDRHQVISALHDEIEATSGVPHQKIDPRLEDRVVEIVTREGEQDVLAAFERAIMEDAERYEGLANARRENPATADIPGWDDHVGPAASRDGAVDPGQRGAGGLPAGGAGAGDGGQPRDAGLSDRAPPQAQLDQRVSQDDAWRQLATRQPDYDDPDVVAASKAAEAVQPPPTKLDERVAASEKAEAFAKQMYDMFAHRLPEEDRTRLDDLIKKIEDDNEARETAIVRGGSCLFGVL